MAKSCIVILQVKQGISQVIPDKFIFLKPGCSGCPHKHLIIIPCFSILTQTVICFAPPIDCSCPELPVIFLIFERFVEKINRLCYFHIFEQLQSPEKCNALVSFIKSAVFVPGSCQELSVQPGSFLSR